MKSISPVLVLFTEGLDHGYVEEIVGSTQKGFLSSANRSKLRLPSYCHGKSAWASMLTGLLPHEHRLLSHKRWLPSELGNGDEPQHLLHQTLLDAADLAGQSTASVNLPIAWSGTSEKAWVVGEGFFHSGRSQEVRGCEASQLLPARVPPEAITEGHLKELCVELAKVPIDDRRRQLCSISLANALSQHNVATAIVSEPSDLVVIRYDWLGRLFGLLIDHEHPAPYIPAGDEVIYRNVLRSAVLLMSSFIDRLAELAKNSQLIVISDHGWKRCLPGTKVRSKPIDEAELSMMATRHAEDYHHFESTIYSAPTEKATRKVNSFALPAAVNVTKLTQSICESLNIDFGISKDLARKQISKAIIEKEQEASKGHDLLDDGIELGLISLSDADDAQRESNLLGREREVAASLSQANEAEAAIEAWQQVNYRRYSFSADLQILQHRSELSCWDEACQQAGALAKLAPNYQPVLLAWAKAAYESDRLEEIKSALRWLNKINPLKAKELAGHYDCNFEPNRINKLVKEPNRQKGFGSRLAFQRDSDWWKQLDADLAEDSCTFMKNMLQLQKFDHSEATSLLANFDESEHKIQLTQNERRRTRGIASIYRHADPKEALNFYDAYQASINTRQFGAIREEASHLHKLLFKGFSNIAGQLRPKDSEVQIQSYWLDGKPISKGARPPALSIASQYEAIDEGIQNLGGIAQPPLIAAALYHDFGWIHPFIDGNGRTGRLLAERMLRSLGIAGLEKLNLERRLDRRRAIFDGVTGLARVANRPHEFIAFWVKFLAQSAQDAVARSERLLKNTERLSRK